MGRFRSWGAVAALILALLLAGALGTALTPSISPAAAVAAPADVRGHAAFSGKLVLVVLQDKTQPALKAGRTLWGLQRPITYQVHAGETITVPAGFVTDLASIPRPVWNLYPPDGPWAQAAVIHDFLYQTQGTGDWHGRHGVTRASPYSREEADGILRQAMEDIGVGSFQRTVIWSAVRAGGSGGWGR
jgi:hypothetical protein